VPARQKPCCVLVGAWRGLHCCSRCDAACYSVLLPGWPGVTADSLHAFQLQVLDGVAADALVVTSLPCCRRGAGAVYVRLGAQTVCSERQSMCRATTAVFLASLQTSTFCYGRIDLGTHALAARCRWDGHAILVQPPLLSFYCHKPPHAAVPSCCSGHRALATPAPAHLFVIRQSSTAEHARRISPGLSCFSFSRLQSDWKLELSI
jgi:hypothetical protein